MKIKQLVNLFMLVSFIKTSHQNYTLECILDGRIVFSKTLEAKSFLRHDLMHFVVESTTNLKQSFFGQFKYSTFADEKEIAHTELVVAILQGLNKDPNYSSSRYLATILQAFETQQNQAPNYLSLDFILKVEKDYLDLLRQYNSLKTGQKMNLAF